VPANTRANIWPAVIGDPINDPKYALLQGRRFAVFLESVGGEAFVAERAMYWSAFVGGHANAGTAWTGAISAPAQAPADVKVTSMSPSAGRLSGGTVVTISGENFGSSASVLVGGVPVAPTSVGPNTIRFTMPARSVQTGYGSAGPIPVSVSAQGRFVRGPSFTRYFSVLAFGDSLTWGTRTFFIAGQKVSTQTSRSYPRGVKDSLEDTPQFGPYALVSNAGWPGEWVTASGFNSSPGGITRAARCTAGQANCFYPTSPDPRDYLAPHDVAVLLEGVNDLNNAVRTDSVTTGVGRMVADAKAKGLQVLLLLFGPYGVDSLSGQEATFPDKVREFNQQLSALAAAEAVSREPVSAQMGPDGLHPTQTGYDEMADTIARKLIAMFPRCGADGVCP
jgi:lysophospholipase L1-like esterase